MNEEIHPLGISITWSYLSDVTLVWGYISAILNKFRHNCDNNMINVHIEWLLRLHWSGINLDHISIYSRMLHWQRNEAMFDLYCLLRENHSESPHWLKRCWKPVESHRGYHYSPRIPLQGKSLITLELTEKQSKQLEINKWQIYCSNKQIKHHWSLYPGYTADFVGQYHFKWGRSCLVRSDPIPNKFEK